MPASQPKLGCPFAKGADLPMTPGENSERGYCCVIFAKFIFLKGNQSMSSILSKIGIILKRRSGWTQISNLT
jgi:hypothetical protein